MMDQQQTVNKQLAEFLNEYKSRFNQINQYNGMPGKIGYFTKLKTGIHTLSIFLTDKFPYAAPIVIVNPRIDNEICDQYGTIIDLCLKNWNFNSTLKNIVATILTKLEGSSGVVGNYGNVGNISQIPLNKKDNKEDEISNELVKDLNSKSLEELILIYYNEEDYVYEFTNKLREANLKTIQEIDNLSEQNTKLKDQYEIAKSNIETYRLEFEEKEKQLKELVLEKQALDSRFTNEKLIEEIKKHIEEQYQKPRQKLIADFLAKKIDFESFKVSFKELSVKFHYYTIIKEKLIFSSK